MISVYLRAQEEFVQWYQDDQAIVSTKVNGQDQYLAISLTTGQEENFQEEVSPVKADELVPISGARSKGQNVVVRDVDLFLIGADGSEKKLTDDEGVERNPKLSADGSAVAYTKNHDLYVFDLLKSREQRLTHDGSEST